MGKRKLIFILLSLVFVTGCGIVEYDLDIRKNNIYEHLNIELNDYYTDEELKTLIEENINSYSSLETENISYETNNNSISIYNKFNNIYDIDTNKITNRLYENVNIDINNNITSVTFEDYNTSSFVCGEFDESCSLVLDKIMVSLTSEYEIISSNADLIDKKNNKHTWILDSESGNIYFSYSDKILWNIVIKNIFKGHFDMVILIVIGIAIVISGLIILGKFLKAIKTNND